MTFLNFLFGIVSLIKKTAEWFQKKGYKQEGRDDAELEGRREQDRIDDVFRNADPDSVSDDEITRG